MGYCKGLCTFSAIPNPEHRNRYISITLPLDPAILLFRQPIRKSQRLRMHFLDLPNIGIKPDGINPPKHNPQIRHHPHKTLTQERKRRRYPPPHNPPKNLAHLLKRQLVPGKVNRNIPVPRIIRADERLRAEIPNIGGADQLDLMPRAQGRLNHRHKHPAHEVRRDILHKRHGPEYGVAHPGAAVRPRLEVLLDIVLADEVRDVGGVGVSIIAVPLDGGIDEVLHAVGERGVDEGFALLFFRRGRGAAAEGELDAEDGGDGDGGGGEDGGAVVEVAFEEYDVGGFLRECGG